jgi:hypothetical protein
MNTKKRSALILTLVLLGGAALVAMTLAAPGNAPLAPGGAPTVVAYQGEVRVGGTSYTGSGYFKFAVVNAAGDATYWSNNGTSTGGGEPTAAVQLAVSEGLFSVLLGDTTLGGMTQPLTADVFSEPDLYLRVWFSTSGGGPFDQLMPDTRIAAVPYALQAERVRGYAGVVVVAKSGGDYTSVQAAIDSITDATASNPYLVWVAPGVYSETVAMKPYVHLQGAGQEATVITSAASDSAWPPDQATLVLASDTSLRDLTVGNGGAGDANVALLATAGVTRTLVAEVTARVQGDGLENYPIVLSGSGTGVTLQQVTALAENGSGNNVGLFNLGGAAVVLRGGAFTGRGGQRAWGIFNNNSDTTLEADSVIALGENGSTFTCGLFNHNGAAAVLRGGSFSGRGGLETRGVENQVGSTLTAENITALAENGGDNYGIANYNVATATLSGGVFTALGGVNNYAVSNELTATMKADNVASLAENGSNSNYGLWNANNATAVVHGASFTGRGGTDAYGVNNGESGTTLEAENVTALGENASNGNHGLLNSDGAEAVLHGGSFTGRGGAGVWGIGNADGDTTLEADNATALAENGSDYNCGLDNYNTAEATVRGGSFTARGGLEAKGIHNDGDTTMEAVGVTALGENGSSANYGLDNHSGADGTLRGGSFTARGGTTAYGIYNGVSGSTSTTLEAENVTALAENGSSNYGLYNDTDATATADSSQFTGSSNGLYMDSGTVHLGVSQLDGGATRAAGSLTCFQVYDGSYAAYTCP